MRPAEVNLRASTNLIILLSHLLFHSALKVCNSDWSNGCAVKVHLVELSSAQCVIIAANQQAALIHDE